jgi:hypothetical protein
MLHAYLLWPCRTLDFEAAITKICECSLTPALFDQRRASSPMQAFLVKGYFDYRVSLRTTTRNKVGDSWNFCYADIILHREILVCSFCETHPRIRDTMTVIPSQQSTLF